MAVRRLEQLRLLVLGSGVEPQPLRMQREISKSYTSPVTLLLAVMVCPVVMALISYVVYCRTPVVAVPEAVESPRSRV